jgi:hypothetical protein
VLKEIKISKMKLGKGINNIKMIMTSAKAMASPLFSWMVLMLMASGIGTSQKWVHSVERTVIVALNHIFIILPEAPN